MCNLGRFNSFNYAFIKYLIAFCTLLLSSFFVVLSQSQSLHPELPASPDDPDYVRVWDNLTVYEKNLLPFYGNTPKSKDYKEFDQKFLHHMDSLHNGNRDSAHNHMIALGWKYFMQDQLDISMKRFNQAYLLKGKTSDVYWGFGAIYGRLGKMNESIDYLKSSEELDNSNPRIYIDLAESYRRSYKQLKKKYKLKEGIKYADMALERDSSLSEAAIKAAMMCYYMKDYEGSRLYLHVVEKNNDMDKVNPRFLEALKEAE